MNKEVKPYNFVQIVIGILFIFPMLYFGFLGFIARGMYYGFITGMHIFDDFFEIKR